MDGIGHTDGIGGNDDGVSLASWDGPVVIVAGSVAVLVLFGFGDLGVDRRIEEDEDRSSVGILR